MFTKISAKPKSTQVHRHTEKAGPTLSLGQAEKLAIRNDLIEAKLPRPYFDEKIDLRNSPEQYEQYLSEINCNIKQAGKIVGNHLMARPELRELVKRFSSGAISHFLLKNTPIEETIKTPEPYGLAHEQKSNYSKEWFILGLVSLIGNPMTYTSTKNGQVLHTVSPDVNNVASPTSAGSDSELNMHVDSSAMAHYPDALMLSCSRPDMLKMATTSVYPVEKMLEHLSAEDIEILASPRYAHQKPAVTTNGNKGYITDSYDEHQKPQPVLYKQRDGSYKIDLTFNGTQPYEDRYPDSNIGFLVPRSAATQALQKIKTVADQTRQDYKLDTGDILVFSNDRAMHSRSRFLVNKLVPHSSEDMRESGHERWLTRVYVKSKTPTDRNGDPDPIFKTSAIQGIAIPE